MSLCKLRAVWPNGRELVQPIQSQAEFDARKAALEQQAPGVVVTKSNSELAQHVEDLYSLLGGEAEAMMSSAFGERFAAVTTLAEALLESSPNLVEDSEALLTKLRGTSDPIIKDPGGSLEPIDEETSK